MPGFNPFLEFLETEPRAAFFSHGNRFGGPQKSQRQTNYYQNQFNEIYDQYLGNLGQQARGGTMPAGSFNDFLGGFDFEDWYRRQVPYQQRNPEYSILVPNIQWRLPSFFGQQTGFR